MLENGRCRMVACALVVGIGLLDLGVVAADARHVPLALEPGETPRSSQELPRYLSEPALRNPAR
jgi:hypothetical protein